MTRTAHDLATFFGASADDVDVPIGNPDGWGWADAVLAAQLPPHRTGNPYEYTAYEVIATEYPSACDAVERGDDGADDKLRDLLRQFREAMR